MTTWMSTTSLRDQRRGFRDLGRIQRAVARVARPRLFQGHRAADLRHDRESTDPFHLELNGKGYDLRQGRVLVLHGNGNVEQLKLFPPLPVANSPDTLVKLFAPVREMNTEPVTLGKLRAQLEAAEAQLDDLLKTHAPEHKLVIEVRRSIEALKKKTGEQTGPSADTATTFSPVMERELSATPP